ncbi:HEPN/Toprim-associated domain-containing protein [Streptomyces sp. NPDC059862]|uniref:HEPN/Toprim-associated domain-containing protein n=1 Tax=Streptomyces sp. NPDC059862 TaxID=3346975 RepID=UPI003652B06D
MAFHSHLGIADHQLLYWRGECPPELAALFTESERQPAGTRTPVGSNLTEFVYGTTVARLRERLHVQGFNAARAKTELAEVLAGWKKDRPLDALRFSKVSDVHSIEAAIRQLLAMTFDEAWPKDITQPNPYDLPEALSRHMDRRSLTRLLLEWAPDPHARVFLDLSELTGPGVDLDPAHPVAGQARAEQLASLAQDAPLLVLTEGPTDARLLAAGMEVTHPHLKGYVTFFDFAVAGAEGGVAQLAKTVSAFVAAGVANRFVALADNDTEAHAGLANLKKQPLPERCRVLHYPPLSVLEAYPTLGPYGDEPVPADVNGRAGSLEMYLGRDVLQSENHTLVPVQWRSWNPKLRRYQGTLAEADKKAAQERFLHKVQTHRSGQGNGHEDWDGIRAIIDTVVAAFD